MSRIDKVNELIARRQEKHSKERLRLDKLFDENSFVEIGAHNTDAGVVTGYGTINGALVYAFSQDGAVNVAHATKIANLYSLAIKMGNPVVGIMDSKGVDMTEGLDTLEAFGIIMKMQTEASGVIPQISVIAGDCMGMGSFIPVLADFVIMTKTNSTLFMQSPSVFSGLEGKANAPADLNASRHAEKTGLVHMVGETEEECFELTRKLLAYLPENNLEIPMVQPTDDINRIDNRLNEFLPEDNESPIDMKYLISSIADNGEFFEIHGEYSTNLIEGFIHLDGMTAGVIANNGLMNITATLKAGEFVNICDAFNIPIVTLTDVAGYERKLSEEINGIEKYGAKLIYSFANATVPKINIIIRNAIGNPYMLMNSKHIGADIVYAWPSACVALMEKKAYTKITGTSSEDYDALSSPYNVEGMGYVDSLIVPSNTRKRIIVALEMLMTKRENKSARKHSSIEF